MVADMRGAVCAIWEDKLGLKVEQVGTHSQISRSAMVMYLWECPVYTIMMIGRWSSDAFLRYIRKQVEQFSHNFSRGMIRFQFHRNIPDLEPAVSQLDTRQRNHPDNSETIRNTGGNFSRRVRLPAMSLYNWVNRGTAWDAKMYWRWKHICAERVRARGETLIEKFPRATHCLSKSL